MILDWIASLFITNQPIIIQEFTNTIVVLSSKTGVV